MICSDSGRHVYCVSPDGKAARDFDNLDYFFSALLSGYTAAELPVSGIGGN